MEKTNREKLFGRCRIITLWSNWEPEIHSDDAQIARQGRAMLYPFSFNINKENNTARFSSTSSLPYYDTTLADCTCFDFQERKLPCKHIYRLAVELGMVEIVKRGYDAEALNDLKKSFDIDAEPEQIKRQNSGMDKKCTPATIDYDAKTATFTGSGKNPYMTTIESCTCRDYFIRKLPCKHIYRLRYELSKKTAFNIR